MYTINLTHEEKCFIEGLLEQEYNGLEKAGTYKGEFKDEMDMCDLLMVNFAETFEIK
jgi:hypothetical protein